MATNTTATATNHTGNGSTNSFAISFSFLANNEIDVTVAGVLKTLDTHYTISGSTVTFTSGNTPANGAAIKFQRNTNISAKKVDFTDGSVLTETDLDTNSDQVLFAQQEITDKLGGIEEGATADQTNAEIKTAYEANSDTNAFTDALQTKLNAIESGATADQTNAEIRAAVEAASDSNVFTDNDHTKLNNIEDNATADQTVSEIKNLIAGSPLDASHLAANSVDTSELADNAVTNAKLADTELVTLAGMQSATASKLADSTALTSDIADLNQLDGMQKATTITDDDTKFPTSGAIVEYVAAQLAPIGGLEAIANESSFPNTQPASGVVISIADAGGMAVASDGTASGTTVGGTTVNISGIASNFRGSSVAAGVRFLVVSTGAGQNYTYHKATLKEDDLVGLSGDINDFGERYRVGSSFPTTNNDSGDLFWHTTLGKLYVYNGTTSAFEETQSIGNFFISTLSPAFDGSTTNFTLSNAPTNAQQVLLIIEGVLQKPNAGTSTPSEGFALDGSTVKLAAAPATGASYHAVVMGTAVNIGTPSNNTVGASQLQNGAITNAHVAANAAIDASKIANLTTDAITEGNSKAEVIGSGTDNGEFKVGLQDSTYNGANKTALRMYQPSDASNKLELFEDNTTATAALSIKHLYSGNGTSSLNFTSNDNARHASIKYWGNLQSIKHYIAGAEKFALGQTSSILGTNLIPATDSTHDLGSNTVRWTNVYADTLYGDGSNLTNLSAASLTSGTIPDARFPSTLPAISGANLTGLSSDSLVKNFTLASGASTTNAKVINTNQSGEVEQLPQMSSVGTFITATDIDNVVYSKDLSNQNYRVKFAVGNSGNAATITLTGQILNADGTVTSSGTTQTLQSDSESNNNGYSGGIAQWYGQYWIAYAQVLRANNGSTSQRNARVTMQMFTVNQSTGAISMLGSHFNSSFNYYASALGGNAYTLNGYVGIYMSFNTAGVFYYYSSSWDVYSIKHYKLTTSGLSQIQSFSANNWQNYSSSNTKVQFYPSGYGASAAITGTKTATIGSEAMLVSDFTGTGGVHAQESSTDFNSGTNAYSANGMGKFLNGTHFIYFYRDINNKRKIQTYSYDQNGAFTLIDTLHYETRDSAITADQIGEVVEIAVKSATEIAVLTQNSVNGNYGLSSVKLDSSYNIEGIKKPLIVAGTINHSGHRGQNHGLHYSGSNNVFFTFNTDSSANKTIAPYTVNSYKDSVPFIYGGVAQETTSSGTAKIALGGVATGFSGLVVGTKYYVDPLLNGNITTASTSGIVVGTAIKATEMLIGDVR